jgi:5-methylcytosine-specific restriction endonuclease McrA
MPSASYCVDREHDSEWPTCACGCGEPVKAYRGKPQRYLYKHRAQSRVPYKLGAPEKACRKCGVVQPLVAYPCDKRSTDGRCSECRECRRERNRGYRERNPDSHREYLARRRAQDPEGERERKRLAIAAYRAANIDYVRLKRRTYEAARKARKLAQWDEHVDPMVVFERDHGVCGICGHPVALTEFQVDHVVPLSRGGRHGYANVRVAHGLCNRVKKNRLDEEMTDGQQARVRRQKSSAVC